ncbi:hypothetical protein D0X99_09360 [Algoriphagus lacus]|uniref:VLRF1 domain-containing protein n=1 Tax=Algoriphagus lacus TaxID=2056311 RepID=A0A418PRX5_9BACT|nr:hypothetical protein [Algoriphagus lacus]RIW15629.1 hypothetical protein D0X99_09360 [Algoriphagus lacus]
MNIPQAKVLSQSSAEKLISDSKSRNFNLTFEPKKHQLIIDNGQDWLAKLYLPLTVDWTGNREIKSKADPHFSLVLIKAGQAVTGYFHRGELLDHRVFRAYMVRQKQGKSQIKHLKTKGKSRAGSRIRLSETEHFFEEINERLTSYSNQYPIDFWGISCAKTMWPYYFSSAVPPPFSPKEESLIELPVHIAQASFEELKVVGELLQKFHLILSDHGKEILSFLGENDFTNDSAEDW